MRKSKEDHEDSRIKACKFCGGKAYWVDVVICRSANKTGDLPEGAVLSETKETLSGGKVYFWERHGYGIHCLTPKCPARTAH